jgi:hypothetical protein
MIFRDRIITYFSPMMVYLPLSLKNCLIATAILCGSCLQGCRSSFQVDSDDPVPKKLRKTNDDVQSADHTSVLSVPYAARSDIPNSRLPVAIPPTALPLGAIFTVQVNSPTYHLAAKSGALYNWKQVPSKELEATDANTSARSKSVFGAKEWSQYFGKVEAEPSLPPDIEEILNGSCPFWSGKQAKNTHLLVLIPATVNGNPFSLNLLGELIQHPQGGGYSTKYDHYDSAVREQFGAQSPTSSYWVLMTRDMLEGSRGETCAPQQALVAAHASRTGLPYELPGALEAATAILSHYVRSGERLYADDPWTDTRCQDMVNNKHSVVVGGFSSGGLKFHYDFHIDDGFCCVSCLRKF